MFTGDQPIANKPSCDTFLISGLQYVSCVITLKLIRMNNFGFGFSPVICCSVSTFWYILHILNVCWNLGTASMYSEREMHIRYKNCEKSKTEEIDIVVILWTQIFGCAWQRSWLMHWLFWQVLSRFFSVTPGWPPSKSFPVHPSFVICPVMLYILIALVK